ncbi:hypothetical protein ABGV40_14110 [Paenibacillus amylolyticus]|uniref:hypothetical protein n=1 Tax=Paenibacillus amylolyticus TaxID=1451 RepID=UPI0032427C9F
MTKVKQTLLAVNEIPKKVIEGVPFIGPVLGHVYEDFITRQLSKLEERRIDDAHKYCIRKIEEKIKLGFRPRDDDWFFANNENYRSNASEIFEGVLTKCKLEHEQKKSRYINNLFINISFEKVSLAQANFLLKLVGTMTFRQLLLLNLFNVNKGNNLMLNTKEVTIVSENISIYQEVYELTQLGLLQKLMDEGQPGVTWKDLQEKSFNAKPFFHLRIQFFRPQ